MIHCNSSTFFYNIVFFSDQSCPLLFQDNRISLLILILNCQMIFRLFPSIFFICYLRFHLYLKPCCICRIISGLYTYIRLLYDRKIRTCNNPCSRISLIISITGKLFHRKSADSGLFLQFPSCCVLRFSRKFTNPPGRAQQPILG